MSNRKKKYNRPFGRHVRVLYRFCWWISVPLLRVLFQPQFSGARQININKQGCILLANHQSNIDPFLINAPLNRQVQYLVSDSNMRSSVPRLIFGLVGGIAKAKFAHDFQSMRKTVSVVRGGGIVGIFPEGLASWDGESQDTIASTAKLLKFLRVAVYSARIHGSFFTLPRWGNSGCRRGHIQISYHKLLEAEEIASLTEDAIHHKIQSAIHTETHRQQQQLQHTYRCKTRAEYVEQMLFLCSQCAHISTLHSYGNTIRCTVCGLHLELDARYHLQSLHTAHVAADMRKTDADGLPSPPAIANVADWNAWQRNYWRAYVHTHLAHTPSHTGTSHPPLLLPEETAIVQIGNRQRALSCIGRFHVSFATDGAICYRAADARGRRYAAALSASTTDEAGFTHNAAEITAQTVQNGELFEYYYRKKLYQVAICNKRRNAYKWMLTINYAKEATLKQPV